MIVGCRGSTDDKLYGVGVGSSLAQQLLGGPSHHIGSTTALFGLEDVACLDANAFHNPLVAGIYDTRHFLVIEDIVGHISAHAGYYGVDSFHWHDL